MVRVKAMAREEGKALGIEKFDRLWVLKEDYLYKKKLRLPLLGMKPDTM